jgi:hypothetical protein
VRQRFLPLTGHGGTERGGELSVLSGDREDRGRSTPTELIRADSIIAVAIYCRNGGGNSTSDEEALSRSSHGSSKPTHHEVMRSTWRLGGPWLRLIIGRGLPSCWPLLLGSDASRTPGRGGGGVQGLDCKLSFSSLVLFVKGLTLSLEKKSPRLELQRLHLYFLHATF